MEKLPTVQELFDLTGKIAFVTGGARNLGFDMALALAEAGADVCITSRQIEDARNAAAKIKEATGRRVLPIQLDVRFEDQVIRAVDEALEEFGQIDILVNNAGNVVATPESARLENRSLEDWYYTIDVNLTGTFLCCKHVVRKTMMPRKTGVIINIGSIAGMIGKDRRQYQGTNMGGWTADYCAAKGGVINMTRDLACYLAPYNIRVNCISPGGFWRNQPEPFVKAFSESIPMGRMGQDGKDLKGAVVFFASEASSYCTGQNLAIDGGLTAW
ncbi:MAG: SDR family oxidoreductase [Armatimonadota bacterium]|nr:SDR family oxidoreductase [Armatimonadota bacterium]